MNQTVLYPWHTSHGGRMVDFAGWQMPIQYTSIRDEHQAVRERAGLFDISHMGRLKFTGADSCQLLDRVLTNHVAALEIGQVRYSLVCNESGGILDDVLVYRFPDCYRLVVNASNRVKIIDWINSHSSGADAVLHDETMNTCMVAIQGPQALGILRPLVAQHVPALKNFTVTESNVAECPSIVSRTGYTGEDGFEIIVDAANGPRLWDTLMDAGREAGLLPCGLGARDTLRLESGMPLYGHELDETIDPLTAGLGFGVKLNTGEFIGRDALLRIQETPTGRIRVGMFLEGKRIAREGAPILAGDLPVGHVTSGTFSPTLDRSVAMGYVASDCSADGTTLEVDIRSTRVPAVVTPLPFYRRKAK